MPSIPGFQRHHIIPWDFHDHPAIRRAGNLFNMGGVQNIMYLPECVGLGGQTSSPKTAGTHRGNTTEHRDYSDEMEGNLDTIFRRNMSRKCTARAIRAFPVYYDPYPAALKKFAHSSCENSFRILPTPFHKSSTLLSANRFIWAFSFEKAISIGFRSGE